MTLPLRWTAGREEDLPRQIFYDPMGAATPEAAQLPISYWTKERILSYIGDSPALRITEVILEKMPLADLRAVALEETDVRPTGRICGEDWRSAGEWRNTRFYSLNVGWLAPLAETLRRTRAASDSDDRSEKDALFMGADE